MSDVPEKARSWPEEGKLGIIIARGGESMFGIWHRRTGRDREQKATVDEWSQPFEVLRKKWKEVPGGGSHRLNTEELLKLPDGDLLDIWTKQRLADTTGDRFAVRGWYHHLYADVLRGKAVLDVGSGLGIDAITFAQAGARVTCADIVQSNLDVIRRLCVILELKNVDLVYMADLDSIGQLPLNYDVIWCQGSMINVPFDLAKEECGRILEHLKPGGRWIELAYPRERWVADGKPSFETWGNITDGEGTPWVEWYDLDKLFSRLAPANFEVILAFNFWRNKWNWFDLLRVA